MSAALPSFETCCNPCTEPTSVAIPGPQGAAGTNGTNGTNGVNAFTTTTADFTMPAELANVTIAVGNSSWASVGQVVFIRAGGSVGSFEVASIPDSTHIQITNLEDSSSGAYATNSPAGTVFASGATVSPAGREGPSGSAGTGIVTFGNGSPEGAVTAPTGRFYFKEDAPIAFWLKTSGSGNTGWTQLLSE